MHPADKTSGMIAGPLAIAARQAALMACTPRVRS